MRRISSTGIVAALALAVVGIALAATHGQSSTLSATLSATKEVPKPAGASSTASGAFTGTLTEGTKDRVAWKLTFAHLTGKAVGAHIHLGKPGHPGPVLVSLCGPCRSGQTGSAAVSAKIAKQIQSGSTYVNVHTTKNAGGEIRGQIKSTS